MRSDAGDRHRLSETEAIAAAELARTPVDDPPPRLWHLRLTSFAAVGAGGVLGANARYQIGNWIADLWGSAFPWGTFLINVSGSLALGFFLTLATERIAVRPTFRLLVATGFLGAYTTFSAFGYEAVRLIQDGEAIRAVLYVLSSLLVGIAATVVGMIAARLR